MRRFILVAAFVCTVTPVLHARSVAVAGLAPGEFLEGNEGVTPVTATVTRTGPTGQSISGTYQPVNGTATAADNDFDPQGGNFTIPADATSTTVTVFIRGDTKVESNETFFIQFTNVDNPPLMVTIVNDDVPVIAVANATRQEGNTGTSVLIFAVTLNAPAAIPVQAAYTTADGTATAGVDYQPAAGTVAFAAGETQRTVNVTINGDITFEPDETLSLTVTRAGAAPVTATGTIINDDAQTPSRVSIESGNNQSGVIGRRLAEPLVVRVFDENGAIVQGVTVQWRVTRGTAQLDPATSTTGSVGRAATNVTPESLGPIDIEASVGQLGPVTFRVNSITSLASRATGPVAVPIAEVLDGICARNEETFNSVCSALGRLPDEQLTPALERVAPQQSGAESKVASEVMSIVTSGIGARLTALRSGTERFSVQQLSLKANGRAVPVTLLAKAIFSAVADQQTDAGGVPEEDDYNGWSAYLSGNLGSGERNRRDGQIGFDLETRGIMAGIDRQFGSAIFGASVNFLQLDSKLDEDTGSLDTSGYAFSVYGSRGGLFVRNTDPGTGSGTRYDGVHVDGSITIGRNNYQAEHDVAIEPLPVARATSENDANIFALSAGAGLDIHRGRTDFDASLSATWSHASIDDLSEEGSGPLILFVQGHEIESLSATAGLSVRSAIPVSFGVILPTFRGEMVHEFKSGARLVTARFLRDTLGTSFTIPLDRPDANYGRLAAGLQAVFPYGVSAYVEVTQDVLRDDLHYRNIQFNVSKSF